MTPAPAACAHAPISTSGSLYSGPVAELLDTSLSSEERALLERFVAAAGTQLGGGLRAVWLFGSRARGERPDPEGSDVDLLVLVDDDSWNGQLRVHSALTQAAAELGLESVAWFFSLHVNSPDWLAGRRSIESFFIAEVDRDKVVVYEAP